MIIGLYIVGYCLAYYLIRKLMFSKPEWQDVIFSFVFALFSWAVVVAASIFFVCFTVDTNIKKNNSKPPKWL